MSADGHSVFFLSSERLLPGIDQDNVKAYVARLGGGFPPGTATPRCVDDACQGLLSPPPPFSPPVSETLSAPRTRTRSTNTLTHITIVKPRWARRAIRIGALALTLRTNGAGKVGVVLAARIAGTWKGSDHATRTLRHAGSVRLTLHLSRPARAYLAANGTLPIRITARRGRTTASSAVVLRTR